MRALIILISVPILTSIQWSEKPKLKKQLEKLEAFMTDHIPFNHFAVIGYNLTLNGTVLRTETLVDDGTSHSETFDLRKADITYEMDSFDDESAEVYGFKYFWDVRIHGAWFHTELQQEEYAITMVEMLKDIQKSLK